MKARSVRDLLAELLLGKPVVADVVEDCRARQIHEFFEERADLLIIFLELEREPALAQLLHSEESAAKDCFCGCVILAQAVLCQC